MFIKRKRIILLFSLLLLVLENSLAFLVIEPLFPQFLLLYILVINPLFALLIVYVNLRFDEKGRKRAVRFFDEINQPDRIDLDKVLDSSDSAIDKIMKGKLNDFTNHLNSVFLEISRSTKKFNLFASDIFFSARHMSTQSIAQSQGMEIIHEQVLNFQRALASLDRDISEILDQLSQTSHVYKQLGDRSFKAAENLLSLSADTRSATEEAETGLASIEKSAHVVSGLSETMKSLEKSMDHMNQQTSRVGKVIENLEDIAERTHILATNASIEAARAGKSGAGFAVIASDIRKLSRHSSESIQEVGKYLKETSRSINENSHFWKSSVEKILQVRNFGDEARYILGKISTKTQKLSTAMETFQNQFEEQSHTIENNLRISDQTSNRIIGFAGSLKEQSAGYEIILQQVQQASHDGVETSRTAKILSQLANYLKVGGKELLFTLKYVKFSKKRHLDQLDRKEERKGLLYNLEVFQGEKFIGNLGDLSLSGLLLYSDYEYEQNHEVLLQIVFPLGFSQKTNLSVLFTPRRSEPDGNTFRIGGTLRLANPDQRSDYSELLERLTFADSNLHSQSEEMVETDELAELEELEEL